MSEWIAGKDIDWDGELDKLRKKSNKYEGKDIVDAFREKIENGMFQYTLILKV